MNTIRFRFLKCICALIALSLSLTSAQAQLPVETLIPNGDFDTDISGWELNPFLAEPNARWVSEDALDNPASGSAEIDNVGTGNNSTQLGLRLCLPSGTGLSYAAGASARMTTATTEGLPSITINAYDNADCSGSSLHTTWLIFGYVDSWTDAVESFVTPPGTTHLQIFIGVAKQSGVEETLSARFDNIYLVVDDGIFADRFQAL